MKRFSISFWVNDGSTTDDVEIIASDFLKAINWCLTNIKNFKTENIKSVYAYSVNVAE